MTLGEIVLGAFDLATEYARKRTKSQVDRLGTLEDPRVTRADFEQAVIALRFDLMGLELAQIDAAAELHRQRMAELDARLEASRAAGDVPNVTIIEPCSVVDCVGYEGHPGPHGASAPHMPSDDD